MSYAQNWTLVSCWNSFLVPGYMRREIRIADGKMSSSSTLGGNRHLLGGWHTTSHRKQLESVGRPVFRPERCNLHFTFFCRQEVRSPLWSDCFWDAEHHMLMRMYAKAYRFSITLSAWIQRACDKWDVWDWLVNLFRYDDFDFDDFVMVGEMPHENREALFFLLQFCVQT